jgi:hypothetical protein
MTQRHCFTIRQCDIRNPLDKLKKFSCDEDLPSKNNRSSEMEWARNKAPDRNFPFSFFFALKIRYLYQIRQKRAPEKRTFSTDFPYPEMNDSLACQIIGLRTPPAFRLSWLLNFRVYFSMTLPTDVIVSNQWKPALEVLLKRVLFNLFCASRHLFWQRP